MKVFISSTIEDLREERAVARSAILDIFTSYDLPYQPVMCEYDFGSHPTSPKQISLEYVRNSGIFIGIYGKRYGSLLPGEEVSIIEREYREAKKFGKYTLIYVKDIEEPNKRDENLNVFLKKIGDIEEGETFSKFKDKHKLKEEITRDLLKYSQRHGLKEVKVVKISSNAPASVFINGKYIG